MYMYAYHKLAHFRELTVSSVAMAWIWEQNMMHVKREKRNPSNTPIKVKMKARGPGRMPSHPSKLRPTQRKKNHATIPKPNTDIDMM